MKAILKKSVVLVLSLIIVLSAFSFSAFAAGSTSISLSSKSVNVGSTLTITVKFTADEKMYSAEGYLQFDEKILEYVSSSTAGVELNGTNRVQMALTGGEVKTISATMTFKAKKLGQCSLKFYDTSYVQAPDKGFGQITVNGSSTTVNVTDTTNTAKSGNANLKSLYLSNNIVLTPAFNKNVTTYTVNVENSVTKVLLNASVEEPGATIQVVGSSTMKVGANQRTVVVTAPNGTQKKYVININRAAPDGTVPQDPETPTVNPYEVEIGGEKWTLVSEYAEDILLEGFAVSSAMINSTELPVLKNETTGAVLVYAKNADESKASYFTYQEITASFAEYKLISPKTEKLALLAIDSGLVIPTGYYKSTAEIGGHTVEVIRYSDTALADYVIVYAETLGGIKNYYRIDLSALTAQRNPEFEAALKAGVVSNENTTVLNRFAALGTMEKLMVGAVILAILIVIAIIVITIVKLVKMGKPKAAAEFEEFDELDEYEDFEDEEADLIEEDEEFDEDEDEEDF